MKPDAAVLTGDLIASTKADPEAVDAAMAVISGCFGQACGFTRFRGDGWQIYLDNPGYGLWAMLRVAAELRAAGGLESRIALGLGSAEGIDKTNLSTARGTAFVESGRTLAGLSKTSRLGMSGVGIDPLHRQLVELIDERMSHWSREQSEAAAHAWSRYVHPPHWEIAQSLGISRQAVASRLRSAGFAQLDMTQWAFFKTFSTQPITP